ncbi:ATP-binding cassette domain-containing protein [bacterium]|nr:ATP-binding cassette domain-containing protein [bacterium]
MNILEVKNLYKRFPVRKGFLKRSTRYVHAVTDVSLEVPEGSVVGLVGESGCGKTTLGRTILKLIEPSEGEIFFQGKDITKFTHEQMRPLRKDMQIIFQDPFSSLNPRMSIGSALMEPLAIHDKGKKADRFEKAVALLKTVGIDEDAMVKYPHEFSGGQRQRIGIARALSVKPKLVIADEAVSALDISIQAQIINLLMDLKEQFGLTMIFIAHDLKVVEHISNYICVMYLGRVMEVFEASELGNARHPYTKSLISAIPIPDPAIKTHREILQGEIPSPMSPPSGCVFHTRCPMAKPECAQNIPKLRILEGKHKIACDLV